MHVLASTADVIIEQRRLSFFGHVARFRLYQNMAQPVLKLLWHGPQRATMRRGQGNRTTYLGQLRECLGIDNNAEFRENADLSTAVEFNKWTTSRCSARWNHWGARAPNPAPNIAQLFSPRGIPLPTLRELGGSNIGSNSSSSSSSSSSSTNSSFSFTNRTFFRHTPLI